MQSIEGRKRNGASARCELYRWGRNANSTGSAFLVTVILLLSAGVLNANAGEPNRLLADLVELSLHVRDERPDAEPLPFDVHGAVAYASSRRGILVLAESGRAFEFPCSSEFDEQLDRLELGDTVRARGMTSGQDKQVQLTELGHSSSGATLSVSTSEDDSASRDIQYVSVIGIIEEAYVADGQTKMMLRPQGDLPATKLLVRLDDEIDPKTSAEWFGHQVKIDGVLRSNLNRNELLLQEERQISAVNSESKVESEDHPLERLVSRVVYSEPLGRRLLCSTPTEFGTKFTFLESAFAADFRRGHCISFWIRGEEDSAQDVFEQTRFLKPRFISSLSESELPENSGDGLRQFPTPLPELSRPYSKLLGAIVDKSTHDDVAMLLMETTAGYKVMLHVPEQRANFSGWRLGDQVEVEGVYLRHLNQNELGPDLVREWYRGLDLVGLEYSMFVDSAEFIRLKQRPLLLTKSQLLFYGFLGLLVLALGFIWNQTLKSKVTSRTSTLIAVQSHLSKSFEAAREAIVLNDADGMISESNRRFRNLAGIDDVAGLSIHDCLRSIAENLDDPVPFNEMCSDVLERNLQGSIELELGARSFLVYASPITGADSTLLGSYWSFQDRTKERKLEREYLQAQKMEAVGRLSGGIAHDFNNVLTVIGSNMILLSYLAEEYEIDIREFAKPIESSVRRAAELTRQLLDFSRKTQLSFRVLDVNEVVQGVFNIVRRSLDASTHVNLFMSPEPLPIKLDLASLEQVLMNLCINASDAIGSTHGSIRIRTTLANHPLLGSCACLSVEDDGDGMSDLVKEQIFEPFFTTKDRGVGTGLGLSTAFGIIQQHDGDIVCESKLGQGTKFSLYFPICDESVERDDSPASASNYETEDPLTLLLVDDDPLLRAAGTRILSALGHNVLTAENGRVALEVLEEQDIVDAVLLDLIMPEMTGNECYDIIRERWPDLPVAICSGYSANRINVKSDEKVAFLAKPYRISQLCETISKLVH